MRCHVLILMLIKSIVRRSVHEKSLLHHIQQQNPSATDIDWHSFQKARLTTQHNHIFTTKMMFNWLPTNRKLHQQLPTQDELCPYCLLESESTPHAFTCPSHNLIPKIAVLLTETLRQRPDTLEQTLTDLRTNPLPIIRGFIPNSWPEHKQKPWKVKIIRDIWTLA